MRLFYAICTVIFAVASYQIFTDDVSQPIVAVALGVGLGWFFSRSITGD
jgi:hypothetical protein